jgi:predicted outer membrane repeat protein
MLMYRWLVRMVSAIVIITILFSSLPFAPASAQRNMDATSSILSATWYVANTGSDANSCQSANGPCGTISGAIGKATAGDLVKVARGTYMETVSISKEITLSGGWNSAFSVQIGFSIIDGQNMRPGLAVYLTDVSLDRFIIQNCYSPSGAGVANNDGTLTIRNSSIQHNTADSDGGGISNMQGVLTLINTSIHHNFTANPIPGGGDAAGGGIYNWGSIFLNNVTLSNNYASRYGGGIYSVQYARLALNNVTITNNSTLGYGGGIFHSTGETIRIRNSILAGNTSAQFGPDCYGYVQSFGYNLIGNNTNCAFSPATGDKVGTAENPIDPRLTRLQNNGGLTLNHALLPGSPAIDQGYPVLPDTRNLCLPSDQRGVPRPQGAGCDMGAVEAKEFLVELKIGNSIMDSYRFSTSGSRRRSFVDVNAGPVKIYNTDPIPIMMAERVIYKVNGIPTSFSEMMAIPNSQLDTTYWLPWYNNVDLDSQLRFANVSGSPATVHIWIGGQEVTGSPFTLASGASRRQSFPGLNNGPVKMQSNVPIVAAQRIIYRANGTNTSYSEMMALPNRHLDKTYWLPWYNNIDNLNTELGLSNVSPTPATVHVSIGGWRVLGSPFTLAPGASLRQSFPAMNGGPVVIRSDVPILAVQRVLYNAAGGVNTSYSEMMAFPNNQADMVYWLPWYNNTDLDSELRFTNVSNRHAFIHVYAAGREVTGSPFFLLDVASLYISLAGINDGPLKIESNVPIVVSERVLYKVNGVNTSFSEMMGLPAKYLDTTYWLPWYNNVDLDTQLRFGVP